MNFLDEEYIMQQKERLLAEYNCRTISDVIKTLQIRINNKNKNESPFTSQKGR